MQFGSSRFSLENFATACDGGMAKEWSVDLLEIPLGLIT